MSDELVNAIYAINTQSTSPLYRQIIDHTKQAIRVGILESGQQLPSVRTIASNLQVNPMTISKAFTLLEQEGVLIRKKGIGMLVAQPSDEPVYSEALMHSLTLFLQQAEREQLSQNQIITLVQDTLITTTNRKSQ